jgi:hypothetical protein
VVCCSLRTTRIGRLAKPRIAEVGRCVRSVMLLIFIYFWALVMSNMRLIWVKIALVMCHSSYAEATYLNLLREKAFSVAKSCYCYPSVILGWMQTPGMMILKVWQLSRIGVDWLELVSYMGSGLTESA